MKKTVRKTIALAAGMLCLSSVPSVFAANDADVEQLKQQVQKLISQNQELTRRVLAMEKNQTEAAAAETDKDQTSSIPASLIHTHVHQTIQQEMRKQREEEGNEQKINEYVTLFGLVEGEAVLAKTMKATASASSI